VAFVVSESSAEPRSRCLLLIASPYNFPYSQNRTVSVMAMLQQLRFRCLEFVLAFTIATMRFSLSLLRICSLVLLPPISLIGQTANLAPPPKPGADGVYEVPASNLKKLDSSVTVDFPHALAAYEIADMVVVEVAITPEGRVKKAKVVSGKIDALKEAAEKTVKKWAFEPYLINGTPVPIRTEITFKFNNTLDQYHDPSRDVPVHLDQNISQTLVTKRVEPEYPADARTGRIQGAVELRVIIGEDGRVHALHIIEGHPMLVPAAYNAVRKWEFKPYVENGKTLPVDTNVTIMFTTR
jgi:TonB family protein